MDWTTWGTIGDTFGGLAGALLNATILVTTLWIALSRQPRIDRARAEEVEASRVIAWPAETYLPDASDELGDVDQADREPDYHGVVLANTSTSTVRNVDLKLIVRHPSPERREGSSPDFSTITGNRELILPPGTWFIPLQGDESDASYDWKLPIPVDTDGKLQVSMRGSQIYDLRTQQLRQREGQVSADGEAFGIGFLRFTLNTQTWWRDDSGNLRPFSQVRKSRLSAREAPRPRRSVSGPPPGLHDWEKEFENSEVQKRVAAVESNGAAREGNKLIADRIHKHYLGKDAWAKRNQGTGVHLRSADTDGPYIRLAGSGTRFPDSLSVLGPNGPDRKLSRLVFDAVLRALPSSEYSKQMDLRSKTADFWQNDNNFMTLVRGLDAGLLALDEAVQTRGASDLPPIHPTV